MKTTLSMFMAVFMLAITACSASNANNDTTKEADNKCDTNSSLTEQIENNNEATSDDTKSDSKVLVAYFSVTGNTENVAKRLADAAQADLFRIKPSKEYTEADLDWHNDKSRTSLEMTDDKARPEMKDNVQNMAQYEVVYLGYPIWWDLSPRIINTFIESNDFSGKNVIPFATSGSSTIDNSAKYLKETYPNINWHNGKLLNNATEKDITDFVKANNL